MLNKILGVVLIFISLGIVANLIPGTIALVGLFAETVSENSGGIWGEFTASLLIQAVGWVIAYYMFQYGRKLFKSKV